MSAKSQVFVICVEVIIYLLLYNLHVPLNLTDVIPIHKKDCKNSKENYKPVRIVPNISKAYEIFTFKKISEYFDSFFSKF